MPSSGTYALAPDNADFIEESFERIGLEPAKLTARHFRSAIMSLDLLFADWSNEDVRLFVIDEQTQTVTNGTASYSAATGTLYILEGSIRRSGIDTPVHRITREQYYAIPDNTTKGLPTQVYLDRRAGTYYLWNAPENSTDVFRYRRLRRLQDAGTGQQTPDLPYHWWEAMASGLAAKLAEKFAPEREDKLLLKALSKLKKAKDADVEHADTTFGMSA